MQKPSLSAVTIRAFFAILYCLIRLLARVAKSDGRDCLKHEFAVFEDRVSSLEIVPTINKQIRDYAGHFTNLQGDFGDVFYVLFFGFFIERARHVEDDSHFVHNYIPFPIIFAKQADKLYKNGT